MFVYMCICYVYVCMCACVSVQCSSQGSKGGGVVTVGGKAYVVAGRVRQGRAAAEL